MVKIVNYSEKFDNDTKEKVQEGYFLAVLDRVEEIAIKTITKPDDIVKFLSRLKHFDDVERNRITEALRGLASGKDY
jgi:hypothetical protein